MEIKIKIGDIIFIAILIIIICLSLIPIFSDSQSVEDSTVYIEIDGVKYAEVPLDSNEEIVIENVGTVIIDGMQVRIENTTCKDKLCERMGNISKSYQSIICLPNKVIIKIISNSNEFDDIAG